MKVNVDGKEIEVLTAEEAQTKATEAATAALEAYKTEHPDQSSEVTKLQGDLKKTQDDLAAAEKGGNTGQVERLRRERDEAQKVLSESVAKISSEFDAFKKGMVGDVQETLLTRLAGTNKELREKILIEFNNYKPNAISKTDIEERMAKAYQLASGGKAVPNLTDNITSSGARGDGYVPTNEREETANGAAMRKVLGISDEQLKKGREILKKNK